MSRKRSLADNNSAEEPPHKKKCSPQFSEEILEKASTLVRVLESTQSDDNNQREEAEAVSVHKLFEKLVLNPVNY